jgi:hypothetical protein
MPLFLPALSSIPHPFDLVGGDLVGDNLAGFNNLAHAGFSASLWQTSPMPFNTMRRDHELDGCSDFGLENGSKGSNESKTLGESEFVGFLLYFFFTGN